MASSLSCLVLALHDPALAGRLASAAATLTEAISQPAFPLSFGYPLPDLHPAAVAKAHWLPWTEALHEVQEVFVYTDGSFAGGRGAWAFTVFSPRKDGGWNFHGSSAGLNAQRLFGEHTEHAFVAEASAICAALSWALTLRREATLHLFFDCLSAGRAATGEWRIPAGPAGPSKPHATARCLFLLLQALNHNVHLTHVYSHRGNPGNELADVVAGMAALGGLRATGFLQRLDLAHP